MVEGAHNLRSAPIPLFIGYYCADFSVKHNGVIAMVKVIRVISGYVMTLVP